MSEIITMFNRNDLTKQGKMKKRNNARIFDRDGFLKFAKENDLTAKTRYIDSVADLSNGMMIKNNHHPTGIMLGTTDIVNAITV